MKILLLGNYPADRQESMQRFAQVLFRELPAAGVITELIRPEPVFNLTRSQHGPGKYLGYLDKLVLFPARLKRRLRSDSHCIVHILDHSNAFYTSCLRKTPHLVTCHDLLAVRAARGEIAGQHTRWTGQRLQRLIARGLVHAQRIVCVSEATRSDLLRLIDVTAERVEVIPNGLNHPFAPMAATDARKTLARQAVPDRFILHVGADHWYKNRLGLLAIYEHLRKVLPGTPPLLLAGAPLSGEQQAFIDTHQLSPHVHSIVHPGNDELQALYSVAELMVFPSLLEGFGWPIVEAQACGCPVITSNVAPMNEIGGDAAVYVDPADAVSAARRVAAILSEGRSGRARRAEMSLQNAARFSTETMIARYLATYAALADVLKGDPGRRPRGIHPVGVKGDAPLHPPPVMR